VNKPKTIAMKRRIGMLLQNSYASERRPKCTHRRENLKEAISLLYKSSKYALEKTFDAAVRSGNVARAERD
jgi:hypothetical protein